MADRPVISLCSQRVLMSYLSEYRDGARPHCRPCWGWSGRESPLRYGGSDSEYHSGGFFRPPDIHVGGLRLCFTTDSSSFFLSFFIRPLISEFAERNSTISGHMIVRKCDLKMHVRNLGYPFLLQIGGPKPPFFDDFAT